METRNLSKELRLGNYVMDSPINGDEPLKVDGIYSELVIHHGENDDRHIYKEEIRPIPLTDEWLKKFRFKKVEGVFVKGHLKLLAIRDLYWRANYPIIVDVIHVHQLQNIYHSICGEELEINLTTQ